MIDRRKQRRHKSEVYLKVFESETHRQIGELANMSYHGMMLITQEPVKVSTPLKCRIALTQPILGKSEILFDAECRWCRKNVIKDWWESGYLITVSGANEELVSYLSLSFEAGRWKTPGPTDVMTVPMENKRKATRYSALIPFPVYEQKSYRQIGLMVNLSTSGVSLTTPKPVKKGQVLNCRAKLPKMIFQRDYLMFDAQCLWCKKNEEKGWFESGYRLKNVSEHDAVIILHLIIHVLEEQPTKPRFRVVR